MAANSDYVDTFIHVWETVTEEWEALCQSFFALDRQACAELYEQDKNTLTFPRKKQNYNPSKCSILLATGQIAQLEPHINNIKLLLTEIDSMGFDLIKRKVMATPDGAAWKKAYDCNRAQFKSDDLKKLWDVVVVLRLLRSGFEGVRQIAEKIKDFLSQEQIGEIDQGLQGLCLSLHPSSPNYYANSIKLMDKLTVFFFKPERSPAPNKHEAPLSVNSLNDCSSQSSPMSIFNHSDSQLSPRSATNSAPAGSGFINSLMRTISDISLPSSKSTSNDDISDDEERVVSPNIINRPLTPRIPRNR